MRKRTSAISRKAGMVAINAPTCHRSHASKRTCRMRTFSRAVAMTECHRRYSRHHCFASMPKKAAARLRTRLANHRILMAAAFAGASNVVEVGRDSAVSLRNSRVC